jgi:biotin-(acetyl-CoA carboxylase) ligase
VAFVDDSIAVSRNRVVQKIARALLEALEAFEAGGLDAVRAEWEAMDAHAGHRLRVRLADGRVMTGVADGLCEDGALRLVTSKGVREVRSGTVVSARPA